jgi:hypothetical protein
MSDFKALRPVFSDPAPQIGTLSVAPALSVRSLSSREGHNLDKTFIALLGGASALALLSGSPASAASPPAEINMLQPARSFAELLDPIPNAENMLRAENERDAAAEGQPVVVAQYYHHHHHHHYHHHHYHHHHYYDHHYYHHHYHHHHHHHYHHDYY